MMRAIFVDSNIPMYIVGASHPSKGEALKRLHEEIQEGAWLVTDDQVFQEILRRYTALNRKDAIRPALDALNTIVDEVFTVEAGTIQRAKKLLISYKDLPARAAVHVAVMQQQRIKQILTFDRAFDQIPLIHRIS